MGLESSSLGPTLASLSQEGRRVPVEGVRPSDLALAHPPYTRSRPVGRDPDPRIVVPGTETTET